jgi:hypothetical protein
MVASNAIMDVLESVQLMQGNFEHTAEHNAIEIPEVDIKVEDNDSEDSIAKTLPPTLLCHQHRAASSKVILKS